MACEFPNILVNGMPVNVRHEHVSFQTVPLPLSTLFLQNGNRGTSSEHIPVIADDIFTNVHDREALDYGVVTYLREASRDDSLFPTNVTSLTVALQYDIVQDEVRNVRLLSV